MPPILIGTYYGKQETRTSKEEIQKEMQLLNEEINEKKKDGEILLTMDGNGKIGLMGEEISRNGKLLIDTFQQTNPKVINGTEKCDGNITRVNTNNSNKKSTF